LAPSSSPTYAGTSIETEVNYVVTLVASASSALSIASSETIRSLFEEATCEALLIASVYCTCAESGCLSLSASSSSSMKIQGHRLLQTSSYSLKAVVSVEVPLSAYGSSSTQAFYNSLSSNWKQDASTTENDIETGIESFDSTVTAQTQSVALSSSYTTVNDADSSSSSGSSSDLSDEAIGGIVVAVIAALILLLGGLCYCGVIRCCKKVEESTPPAAAEATLVTDTGVDQTVAVMVDAVVILTEPVQERDPAIDKHVPSAPPAPIIEDEGKTATSQIARHTEILIVDDEVVIDRQDGILQTDTKDDVPIVK
jgi:hypothetical protein